MPQVQNLRDLSAISRIDFESLASNHKILSIMRPSRYGIIHSFTAR